MNKQGKIIDNKVVGMIDYTKTIHPDGVETRGSTWNVCGGCQHRCQWKMESTLIECYAKTVAKRVASKAYPDGFESHYWHPERLQEPLHFSEPQKIFWNSMGDLFGSWVPTKHILQVIDIARNAHWHTFLSLTKNAPRMIEFDFPPNVWIGASMSPDFMRDKKLTQYQQDRMLGKALDTLQFLAKKHITWMSFEPLSWDVAEIVAKYPRSLKWAVIGAASNGVKKYQPVHSRVQKLLEVLDRDGIPVFMKDNLDWLPRREEFPA